MAADVELEDAVRSPVAAWRVEDGRLLLTFAGSDEPWALRCVCSRGHWMVETRIRAGSRILAVRCHACGTRGDLAFAASSLP